MFYSGKIKAISVLIMQLCLIFSVANAQEVIPSYLLPDIPQSTLYNPAYQNKTEKLVVGIPVLSGIYGIAKSNVPFNSLFFNNFNYDLNNFYNILDERGAAKAATGISLFFASLKHNEFTYSLSVSERNFSEISFNREIIKILRDGIREFYGSYENFGDASFYLNYFREVAPGFSKQISEKSDAGVRIKFLFGKLLFNARDINLSIDSDQNEKNLNIMVDGSYKFSGPFIHKRDTIFNFSNFDINMKPADYFFGARNLGLAFDAGIIFRPNRFSEISLSITDIGFTGYKKNLYNIEFSRPINYSEDSLYQSVDPYRAKYVEPREAVKKFMDSVSYIITVKNGVFREIEKLPFKLNISAEYKLSEKIRGGIADQIIYYNEFFSNFLTIYASRSLSKKTEVAGNISLHNLKSVYPGFAISSTLKRSQLFLTTNNIFGIINPTASKHVNLCFGINFLFETQ